MTRRKKRQKIRSDQQLRLERIRSMFLKLLYRRCVMKEEKCEEVEEKIAAIDAHLEAAGLLMKELESQLEPMAGGYRIKEPAVLCN